MLSCGGFSWEHTPFWAHTFFRVFQEVQDTGLLLYSPAHCYVLPVLLCSVKITVQAKYLFFFLDKAEYEQNSALLPYVPSQNLSGICSAIRARTYVCSLLTGLGMWLPMWEHWKKTQCSQHKKIIDSTSSVEKKKSTHLYLAPWSLKDIWTVTTRKCSPLKYHWKKAVKVRCDIQSYTVHFQFILHLTATTHILIY